MRTLTTQQTAALAEGQYATHCRVFVDYTGSGNMVNISDVNGRDWLQSVDIKDSIDSNGADAMITVRREEYELSMSPLMSDSQLNKTTAGSSVPFLYLGRDVRIEAAVVPIDVTPSTADWINVFEGEIDDLDWGGDSPYIKLVCRDLSGYLADRWIENNTVYNTQNADGVPVQETMQDILDDWAPGVTLYTPVPPGWNIKIFEQQKEPVLDALRKLAQQIGWEVKYRWDSGTSAWRLTFYEPDRTGATTHYAFSNAEVTSVSQLKITRKDVRNRVKVIFTDAATGDRAYYQDEDTTSQTLYGIRYMEITEDASSQIDTSAEAQLMAEAILSDLSYPQADMGVEVSGFPFVETADFYEFTANDRHFDDNQTLAVVAWSTRYDRDRCYTTLTVRGYPAGAFERWLKAEARPGQAPATDTDGPGTPQNVVANQKAGGLEVTYHMPTDPDWSYSECHMSKSSGFTPSQLTKVGDTRTDRFFINSLDVGSTYYIKVVATDSRGNRSTPSTQISKTIGLIGPSLHNLNTQPANLIPNGDFGVWSYPLDQQNSPPDNWEIIKIVGLDFIVDSTLWGTGPGQVFFDNTITQQNDTSIRFDKSLSLPAGATAIGIRYSELFPVSPDRVYALRASILEPPNSDHYLFFEFLAGDGTTVVGTHLVAGSSPAPGEWYGIEDARLTPSDAAYGRVGFYVDKTGAAGYHYLDRIAIEKIPPSFLVTKASTIAFPSNGSNTPVKFDTIEYDTAGTYDDGGLANPGHYVIPFDADYQFAGCVSVLALSSNRSITARILVNGTVVREGNEGRGGSSFGYASSVIAVQSIYLRTGDQVQLAIYHDDAGGPTQQADATLQWFTGSALTAG